MKISNLARKIFTTVNVGGAKSKEGEPQLLATTSKVNHVKHYVDGIMRLLSVLLDYWASVAHIYVQKGNANQPHVIIVIINSGFGKPQYKNVLFRRVNITP